MPVLVLSIWGVVMGGILWLLNVLVFRVNWSRWNSTKAMEWLRLWRVPRKDPKREKWEMRKKVSSVLFHGVCSNAKCLYQCMCNLQPLNIFITTLCFLPTLCSWVIKCVCFYARIFQRSCYTASPAEAHDWRGHEVVPGGRNGVDQGGCVPMATMFL